MRVQEVALEQAVGQLLLHSVFDATGKRVIRKGVTLTAAHLAQLHSLGQSSVEVAVLEEGDVGEERAAAQLIEMLCTDALAISWGIGGRANLHTTLSGVVYVDVARLEALNTLAGVTLATLPQYSVVHPRFRTETPHPRKGDQVATLKIIPYALPAPIFARAKEIVQGPALLDVHPLPIQRAGLLLIGAAIAHAQLRRQFEPPLQRRLEALNATLATVLAVEAREDAVVEAVQQLRGSCAVLLVAGQTSIMDLDDRVLRALRAAGAEGIVHGAPVDPGSLLALAYLGQTPILCVPGCARSQEPNVVDLVLPRILAGERITQPQISRLGHGGLLGGLQPAF